MYTFTGMNKFCVGIVFGLVAYSFLVSCHDMPEGIERHGKDTAEEIERQEQEDFEEDVAGLDGAVAVDVSGMDGWDEAWLSPEGYVLVRSLDDVCGYSRCVAFRSLDGSVNAYLFCRDDGMPSQLYAGRERLYFNFLDDSLLEIVRGNSEYYDYGAVIRLDGSEKESAGGDFRSDIGIAGRLICSSSESTVPEVFRAVAGSFVVLSGREFAEDGDFDRNRAATGVAALSAGYADVYGKAVNGVLVWSGWTPLEVTTDTARLAGTVQCGYKDFNDFGSYGVVCATDMADLTIERAQFKADAWQVGVSTGFTAVLSGLQPGTTYYSRAYYRFNSAMHAPLTFAYGVQSDLIQYEEVIKTFTTSL